MKLNALCVLYMQSPEWGALRPNSRRIYEYGMTKFGKLMKRDADTITRPQVLDLRDELFHQRGVCRITLAALNNVLKFGYDRGHVKMNHAANMRNMPKPKPFKRWSENEVDRFLLNSPVHLKRAVMLALFTGQRRSDLIRLRWDQYDGRFIHLVQTKTGKELSIPVHPVLGHELALMQDERRFTTGKGRKALCPYILVNTYYDPWTDRHLTRSISTHSRSLDIADRQLHGIRKTTCAKLAEIGCTPHEIASITGQSLQEVEHYTREASQKVMATNAMKRWEDVGNSPDGV